VALPMWRGFDVFPMWGPYLVHQSPQRELLVHSERQQQRANQEAGSTADRSNGWKDMKLAEKCCGHMVMQE
jgi:hypothetical protein